MKRKKANSNGAYPTGGCQTGIGCRNNLNSQAGTGRNQLSEERQLATL